MTEYKPEHILGSLMELRSYMGLVEITRRYVEEEGWSFVVEVLEKCRESDAIVPGWDLNLREGILREGIIQLLGLQDFVGLDVDFLEMVSGIQSNDPFQVQKRAYEIARELLSEQVKRGNTFFMDVEEMKENELTVLIPDVLSSRTQEIERLGSTPHLYEVYSTYYGFKILTSGMNVGPGISADVRSNLMDVLRELGGIEKLRSKQLKFSSMAFRKCAPYLTTFLWNMLRLSLGGVKYRIRALQKLGDLGDSRAIDLIHRNMEEFRTPPSSRAKSEMLDECLLSLGRIGHISSFEKIVYYVSPTRNRALGGIRHPGVVSNLKEELKKYMPRDHLIQLIQGLGNTRSRSWKSEYSTLRGRHRSKRVHDALDYAERNMLPEFSFPETRLRPQ